MASFNYNYLHARYRSKQILKDLMGNPGCLEDINNLK